MPTYRTDREHRLLAYAICIGLALVIACAAALGATNGLDQCQASGHSEDVCLYTLR